MRSSGRMRSRMRGKPRCRLGKSGEPWNESPDKRQPPSAPAWGVRCRGSRRDAGSGDDELRPGARRRPDHRRIGKQRNGQPLVLERAERCRGGAACGKNLRRQVAGTGVLQRAVRSGAVRVGAGCMAVRRVLPLALRERLRNAVDLTNDRGADGRNENEHQDHRDPAAPRWSRRPEPCRTSRIAMASRPVTVRPGKKGGRFELHVRAHVYGDHRQSTRPGCPNFWARGLEDPL